MFSVSLCEKKYRPHPELEDFVRLRTKSPLEGRRRSQLFTIHYKLFTLHSLLNARHDVRDGHDVADAHRAVTVDVAIAATRERDVDCGDVRVCIALLGGVDAQGVGRREVQFAGGADSARTRDLVVVLHVRRTTSERHLAAIEDDGRGGTLLDRRNIGVWDSNHLLKAAPRHSRGVGLHRTCRHTQRDVGDIRVLKCRPVSCGNVNSIACHFVQLIDVGESTFADRLDRRTKGDCGEVFTARVFASCFISANCTLNGRKVITQIL